MAYLSKKILIALILSYTLTIHAHAGKPFGRASDNPFGRSAITLVIIATVATLGISVLITVTITGNNKEDAELALIIFIKENHARLQHDVALASGPFFNDLAIHLQLSKKELNSLQKNLDGSNYQGDLMESLSGEIDQSAARKFAGALTSLFVDTFRVEMLHNSLANLKPS